MLRSTSLARRILWIIVLASGTALATLVIALLIYDNMTYRTVQENRLATLADVVGQNSTAALSFNDKSAAVEALEALRAEPPVVSACLYDLSDRLFAEFHRRVDTGQCAERRDTPQSTSDYAVVTRRVRYRGELLGTLSLTSTMEDLRKRQVRLIGVAIVLLVLSLGVGGVAGSLLQRRISKPILDLSRAMQEVTKEQNFGARISVSGDDDIARLGRGFNAMLSELEWRDLQKKEAEAQLQHRAFSDDLTGLPNRRLFGDRLSQALALAQRESRMVGLLYIDLDGFKLVNDSMGHSIGDLLLYEVAQRLRSRVRESDTLGRVGGDEFMVILRTLRTKEDAGAVARSFLELLAEPFVIDKHEITIGASIGISICPDNAVRDTELMQQADSAMYAAKKNGKNQAMFFTAELGLMARERVSLESQLRGAVARGELVLAYQPEFDMATGRPVRFEALARWHHPTLGWISPAKFIPIAEESGLIVPLGSYFMKKAFREAVRWRGITEWPVQVAVNVSSVQFNRENFIEDVEEALRASGLKPEMVQIELTESVMLGGVERAGQKMRQLRAMGISLAIDDFGTGYSCLSYLPNLPFDALKIDRSFVRDLTTKPAAMAMVQSLVALAHNIGMRVIVEGVEEEAQLELIRRLGCNEAQGFLLGRPMSEPTELLKRWLAGARSDGELVSSGRTESRLQK